MGFVFSFLSALVLVLLVVPLKSLIFVTKGSIKFEENSAKRKLKKSKRKNKKVGITADEILRRKKVLMDNMSKSQKLRYKALRALLVTLRTGLVIARGVMFILSTLSLFVTSTVFIVLVILVSVSTVVAMLITDGGFSGGTGGSGGTASKQEADCKPANEDYIKACEKVWQNWRSKGYDYSQSPAKDSDYGTVRTDCSGYVYCTLQEYGIFEKGTYPFGTGGMDNILMKTGKFDKLEFDGKVESLKTGDICWDAGHTQVYAGAKDKWYNNGNHGHLKNESAYDASWFLKDIKVIYRLKATECKKDTEFNCPEGGLPIPLYLQYTYDCPIGNMSTIKEGGCGYTSLSMALSYLTGTKIEPPDLIAKVGSKYHVSGAGISWSAFTAIPELYGITGVQQTSSIDEVCKALRSSHPVICSQGPGIFTKGGHIILLRGITEDGKILVNDPNDNDRKNYANRKFDPSEISAAAKSYWIMPTKQ